MENNKKEVVNAITQIIQQRGIECIKKPNVFCAILDDMIPNLQKERKIIRKVLVGNEELCSDLYNMCYSKKVITEQEFSKLRYQLKNEYGVSDEWSDFFIVVFSDAFGWKGYDKYLSKLSQESSKKNSDKTLNQSIELEQKSVKKQPKKKRKFTKIILLLLIAILLKSCFADSGDGESEENSSNTSSTQNTETETQFVENEAETINSEAEIVLNELIVDKLELNSIDLLAIQDTTTDISATTIEQIDGVITQEGQYNEYPFIPERDGTYCFAFSNLGEGYYYGIYIYIMLLVKELLVEHIEIKRVL